MLFNNYYKITLGLVVLVELLSFVGFIFAPFNTAIFFIILVLTLILSLYRLEYGLYIVLAELFIGSKGYLFYFEQNGIIVSIRIGLFLVIMSAFVFEIIKNRKLYLAAVKSYLTNWTVQSIAPLLFVLLSLFAIWGLINGFWGGNESSNVFFDFNAWLYFLLLPIFWVVINNREKIYNIINILFAATAVLSLKTIISLFIFAHNFSFAEIFYKWIRNTGTGEITKMGGGLYRIFFQSQIYNSIAFFVILFLLYLYLNKTDWMMKIKNAGSDFRTSRNLFLLLTLNCVAIIISQSRSFWVGFFIAIVSVFFYYCYILLINNKLNRRHLVNIVAAPLSAMILSVVIIIIAIYLPVGNISGLNAISAFGDRLSADSAVASRWLMLNPLWDKIKTAPILGAGFGSTIIYKSQDPRVLATHPDCNYETYAFEWGYLDIWLKIGLLGLLSYIILLFVLLKQGWRIIKSIGKQISGEENLYVVAGLSVGLISLIITNIFSPYLNHPLGIGFLLLYSTVVKLLNNQRI